MVRRLMQRRRAGEPLNPNCNSDRRLSFWFIFTQMISFLAHLHVADWDYFASAARRVLIPSLLGIVLSGQPSFNLVLSHRARGASPQCNWAFVKEKLINSGVVLQFLRFILMSLHYKGQQGQRQRRVPRTMYRECLFLKFNLVGTKCWLTFLG